MKGNHSQQEDTCEQHHKKPLQQSQAVAGVEGCLSHRRREVFREEAASLLRRTCSRRCLVSVMLAIGAVSSLVSNL